MRIPKLKYLFYLSLSALFIGLTSIAHAGTIELSGTFSFSSSSFGEGNVQWTRRWGASIGYYFWKLSEIEIAAQDVLYRTKFARAEDTTFHDQIFSIDWVQSLTSRNSTIQPYVKIGVGQLYRNASGFYNDGESTPPTGYGSLTGVLGGGLRILVHRSLSLKVDGASYLTGGVLSTWQDNFAVSAGASLYL